MNAAKMSRPLIGAATDLSRAAWKRVAKLLPIELHGYAREWGEAVGVLAKDGSDRVASFEWELWRALCDAMVEAGAVTQTDLNTSVRAVPTTLGLQLIQALRAWGDARRAAVGSKKAVNHTPGPWEAERIESGPLSTRELVYFRVKVKGRPVSVAGTSVYCSAKSSAAKRGETVKISDEECEANGALIAAAPDLLAALEHVRDCLDDGEEFDLDRIQPAITKARGGK